MCKIKVENYQELITGENFKSVVIRNSMCVLYDLKKSFKFSGMGCVNQETRDGHVNVAAWGRSHC